MQEDFILPLDESTLRAIRDERLDGRKALVDDLRGGIHARQTIAELNHSLRMKDIGEHTAPKGDFEFRLEAVMHGEGFHALGLERGYDDDDFWEWQKKRCPDMKVKYTPRTSTIVSAGKYSTLPPKS